VSKVFDGTKLEFIAVYAGVVVQLRNLCAYFLMLAHAARVTLLYHYLRNSEGTVPRVACNTIGKTEPVYIL
jgi:hypothetical protein